MKRLLPLIGFLAILLPSFFSHSCANTTQAPTGGPKDSIPPVIVGIKPLPGTTGVPVSGTKIVFTFNEYVTLKNPQNIFLSPPLSKKPVSKVKDKSVVVSFEEDLAPNTTYTLDLNDAIVDNNENNPYAGFTYVFSTGTHIDSLYVTGTVYDCITLKPVKDATVMLYRNHSDSAVFKERPFAAAKTDEWGFFTLPYIGDTLYRMYALMDNGADNIYNPDEDLIGFTDSLVRPFKHITDTTYELYKFNMKDTLECLNRLSDYEINIFREHPSKQYIVNKARTSERSAYVTFMAPDVWIDSLWVGGFKADRIITQFNNTRDSLEIWINDQRKIMPDTLHLFVNYRKTDSLGRLVPETEHFRLAQEGVKPRRYVSKKDIKHEDTTCVFTLKADGETFEKKGFELEFKYPVIHQNFDLISLTSVNPRQQENKMEFTIESDSLNLRRFSLRPKGKILPGWEYRMKVPDRIFRDITGYRSDSTEVKVSLPSDDELSSLVLKLENLDRKIIVDLLSENRETVVRSESLDTSGDVEFKYLKPAKYVIRITDDSNCNSIVDTGSLLEHRQPEKVIIYKIGDQNFIDIPKSSELTQTIDIQTLL